MRLGHSQADLPCAGQLDSPFQILAFPEQEPWRHLKGGGQEPYLCLSSCVSEAEAAPKVFPEVKISIKNILLWPVFFSRPLRSLPKGR